MNKARQEVAKRAQYGVTTATRLSHMRGWKKVIFQTSQNGDPRPWCCSPRPYESNEPKNTSIGVRMKKWRPKH